MYGNPVQVDRAEVVQIEQHEREERQELQPLAHVAEEHLHVLHEQLPPDGRHRQPRGGGVDDPQAGDPGLRRLLRSAVAGELPPIVRGAKHHREGQRRGPERRRVEQIDAAVQAGEQRFARPERRQQRRDRRLQRREEVGDVGQRLDAQQPLGLDEAKHQDQADREDQPGQHQHVARTARRKHVHDQQRRGGADRDRDRRERRDDEHGGQRKRATARRAPRRRRAAPASGTRRPSTRPAPRSA